MKKKTGYKDRNGRDICVGDQFKWFPTNKIFSDSPEFYIHTVIEKGGEYIATCGLTDEFPSKLCWCGFNVKSDSDNTLNRVEIIREGAAEAALAGKGE